MLAVATIPAYDFILQCEDIPQRSIIALGPQLGPGARIGQLNRDSHLPAGLAHAALEHILDSPFIAHVLQLRRLALAGEGRVAGDYKQVRKPREVGDQVIGDTVAEIFLLRIPAEVGEREHRNRGLVGQSQRFCPSPAALRERVKVRVPVAEWRRWYAVLSTTGAEPPRMSRR
jgi:hypothetical protein